MNHRPTLLHPLLLLLAILGMQSSAPAAPEGETPPPVSTDRMIEKAWLGQIKAPELGSKEAIPAAPADHVLDRATVLRPEAAAELSALLVKAQAQDVHVFLVTVPSLKVLPSLQGEQLEILVGRYAAAWIKGVVGAIVLFDDEGGLMTISFSPEAQRRFSSFEIERDVKDRVEKIKHSGLAREKLESSTRIATDVLVELQTKYARDTHRQRIANFLMGTVALFGIVLAVWSATRGAKSTDSAFDDLETEAGSEDKAPPRV